MARIILIDDDRVFARLVEARLQADGHEVHWSEGAFGVLTEVRRGRYQFILVDVQMPGIEGPALVDCLRSRGIGDSRQEKRTTDSAITSSSPSGPDLRTISRPAVPTTR